MSQSEKELTYKAFMNREYSFAHSPFEKEFEFYDWRDTFGFIAEIGDMVVGPMAEEYYKTHEDNR